ncbi:MAG: AAA family ATPase [Oscillospiraceae bacterium]|jgi:broad-specificity NMP kinase
MKTLYLVGGPAGVGKTVISRIMNKKLPNCVHLDGNWCWEMNPFQENDETTAMVMDNICHCLNNFIHCSVFDNIVFSWEMYKQHTIDSILAWIDMTDLNIVNVSLVCSEEELRKRIWKDVYAGLRTPDAIEASIEKIKLYSSLCTTKITITNLSPEEAADKIISLSKKNK